MFVIVGALVGAILGAWTAKRRRGSNLDMLQYAAGFAIAFAIVGLLITVITHRMMV